MSPKDEPCVAKRSNIFATVAADRDPTKVRLLQKADHSTTIVKQGVVTTNNPVEPSVTGIKIKSSDQER